MARVLIEAGADKDASTTDTRLTSLHMACRTGNVTMVQLLLEAGACSNRNFCRFESFGSFKPFESFESFEFTDMSGAEPDRAIGGGQNTTKTPRNQETC